MSQPPFNFAGAALAAALQPLDLNESLLRPPPPAPVHGSRRRKLWELGHKFHCPIIGVCFSAADLRTLMSRVMHFPADTSDYVLHTTAVGACEERSQLAELLQKNLEKRFELTIRRFATARTGNALRALWQEATRGGHELPAALWSSWTHPACDALLEQEIHGDIHMIQHQIGSGARADLNALKALRVDNAQLRRLLDAAHSANQSMRNEKSRETEALGQRVIELRAELAGKEAWGSGLAAQLDQLRRILPDLKDRQALARRVSDAEARANTLSAQVAALEDKLAGLKRRLAQTASPQPPAGTVDENGQFSAVDRNPAVNVAGKCVLCVGGRSGAVDAYRQVIEQCGGRFLHHDGGLEESLHRIDGALAAADLVICQAGCISHNAYWRVKEQCKRTGKPCIYMKTAGVSGLSRLIEQRKDSEPLPVVQNHHQGTACGSYS
jgi:hypothetical protein